MTGLIYETIIEVPHVHEVLVCILAPQNVLKLQDVVYYWRKDNILPVATEGSDVTEWHEAYTNPTTGSVYIFATEERAKEMLAEVEQYRSDIAELKLTVDTITLRNLEERTEAGKYATLQYSNTDDLADITGGEPIA